MSIPEPNVEHHEGRGIRSCPIFPELRPTVTRASEPAAVSSGRQYGDGLEELESTHRNDATAAPRWCFGLATIVPFDEGQPTNRTAARFPAARRLLLAWQLTTDCTAELPAGH